MTTRLGADELNDKGVRFNDSVVAAGWMKQHGLDLSYLNFGFNTDDTKAPLLRRCL